MRKVIAAINMTIDGIFDHTAVDPDAEIHQHYTDLLNEAGAILYGRVTYDLMKFWQPIAKKPSGEKAMDDFALAMDKVPKVVFSRTLEAADLEWDSARLSLQSIEKEVTDLKNQPGKDIFVGSRSLIIQLMSLNLLDEIQLCIHPIIAGSGLPLFENLKKRGELRLKKTKTFSNGAVIHYYTPERWVEPDGTATEQ